MDSFREEKKTGYIEAMEKESIWIKYPCCFYNPMEPVLYIFPLVCCVPEIYIYATFLSWTIVQIPYWDIQIY